MNRSNTTLSRERLAALTLCLSLATVEAVGQGSWMFAPGAFTHDPRTGARTTQYAAHEPVAPLPDPAQTVSRYWRTRTNLRGADGSSDTIYEVRSFGNTLGGFDAQRERGFDASLETLRALRPFRHNPYLFFGGLQGFGYGFPGYPGAVPGTPVPQQAPGGWHTPLALPPTQPTAPCTGPDCGGAAAMPYPTPYPMPYPGMPGTAWPYAPPTAYPPPIAFFGPFGGYPGFGGYGGGPGFGGPGYGGFGPNHRDWRRRN